MEEITTIKEDELAEVLAFVRNPGPRSRLVEAIQGQFRVCDAGAGFLADYLEQAGYIAAGRYKWGDDPQMHSGEIELYRLTEKGVGARRRFLLQHTGR